MQEFIQKGGPFLWPILAASVLALAVCFERAVFLVRNRERSAALYEAVTALLSEGQPERGRELCLSHAGPTARVLAEVCRYWRLASDAREKVIANAASIEVRRFEQGLRPLAAVAATTPLLGLLGTVAGLVGAFRALGDLGGTAAVDAASLASGIWEALLTTVAGLLVAIPAHLAHGYFEARACGLAFSLEDRLTPLLAQAADRDEAPAYGRAGGKHDAAASHAALKKFAGTHAAG